MPTAKAATANFSKKSAIRLIIPHPPSFLDQSPAKKLRVALIRDKRPLSSASLGPFRRGLGYASVLLDKLRYLVNGVVDKLNG